MSCIAGIFARGGSKGLPGKNIKSFHGKPLIAWSIECALSVPRIDRVIVSTDSLEIADIALDYGAEVPFLRPESLATDHSPELLSWQHLLKFVEAENQKLPNLLLSLPATSPLRLPSHVDNCIDTFLSGDFDSVLTVSDSYRNPFFNMVKEERDKTVSLVSKLPSTIYRRQDAPKVYDVSTIAYAASPKFVLNNSSLFSGRMGFVNVPRERSIDIDTILDFQLAEHLYTLLNSDV